MVLMDKPARNSSSIVEHRHREERVKTRRKEREGCKRVRMELNRHSNGHLGEGEEFDVGEKKYKTTRGVSFPNTYRIYRMGHFYRQK